MYWMTGGGGIAVVWVAHFGKYTGLISLLFKANLTIYFLVLLKWFHWLLKSAFKSAYAIGRPWLIHKDLSYNLSSLHHVYDFSVKFAFFFQGGLIARAVFTHSGFNHQSVNVIFNLATPNLGPGIFASWIYFIRICNYGSTLVLFLSVLLNSFFSHYRR